MVNAQDWLERNYSENIRSSITGLDISSDEYATDNEKLVGSLSLKGFHNLEKLNCSYNQLTSLDFSDCFRLEEIDCSNNKLIQLTTNGHILKRISCSNNNLSSLNLDGNRGLVELDCPFNQLDELNLVKNGYLTVINCQSNRLTNLDLNENVRLRRLDCSWNKLERLDLSKNINLDDLTCRNNLLTNLDLSQNNQLVDLTCTFNQINELIIPANSRIENIACSGNLLTQLDWNRLDPDKLNILLIADNNFPSQDLEFLEPFTKLKYLSLSTSNKNNIKRGIYNRFRGSLKPLRKLDKLVKLDINETDIDSGLEYLPESLVSIFVEQSEPYRKEAKVNELFSNLEPYCKESYSMLVTTTYYDLQEWRKDNRELLKKVKEGITNEALLKVITEQVSQLQKELAEEKGKRFELEQQLNN